MRLHTDELLSAVAEYRLWHGPDSLSDEKLCVIFVHETENVREAMAVAAMVVPDLARIVPSAPERPVPVFPSVVKMGSLKPFPDNPPAMAELLNAMLTAAPPTGQAPGRLDRRGRAP